ncbi:MAG: DinB family protein [Phycisphaerales bacterium]
MDEFLSTKDPAMGLSTIAARDIGSADSLLDRFRHARRTTISLCEPLSPEDMVVQAFEHTSPTKWHLAHTTWFFETFILEAFEPGFEPYDRDFRVLFNSYYQSIGERHPREARHADPPGPRRSHGLSRHRGRARDQGDRLGR